VRDRVKPTAGTADNVSLSEWHEWKTGEGSIPSLIVIESILSTEAAVAGEKQIASQSAMRFT